MLLGLAAALALVGCGGDREERTLFVLLTDNRLLRVSEGGEVLSRVRLGPAPEFASYGSLLAASPDGRTVYALARGARQRITAVHGDDVVNHALPVGTTWRRLAVGPRTGRLYIAGNARGRGVRLAALSEGGEFLADEVIRKADGRDWYVQALTIAPGESSALVTYHGTDTTGADLVELDPIRACRDRTPVWGACLAHNHGRAEWVGEEILAATGESGLALLEPSGGVARELPTGLRNVHLMQFVLASEAAFAFADCVKGTGVARVLLDGSEPVRLQGCGDVGALLGDSTLVLGRRWSRGPYGRGHDASLAFVDLESKKVARVVVLPEDPADVLAVG